MADEKKAAFGVFPQMKPRRSKQDREAAKNVPVDLARGVISGALGIPGDIESLARLPYQLITGNESPTILPTSEDIEKRLPFKSDTPVGGVATGLGQIAGGFATPAPAIRAAKKLRQTIGNLPPSNPRMSQMGVIKAPGGNWLGGERGSVEGQLGKLKMADLTPEKELAEMQSSIDTAKRIMGNDETVQRTVAQMENELATAKRNNAINKWVDSNLRNYVKKEMGTEGDPVRKLAERGVLHMKPYGTREAGSLVMRKRAGLGYPAQGLGKSEEAQFWERLSDQAIDVYPAGSYKHGALDESLIEANPWLQNVPDEIMIHSGKGLTRELGFDHIIDVLRQDLREGRIRPEQLNKVSMEQAVRRTAEFDQEMAKRMRDAQIKVMEGMPVYREYPEGYRWIELATPSKLPEKFAVSEKNGRFNVVDSTTGDPLLLGRGQTLISFGTPEEAVSAYYKQNPKVLEDALKYEGETMGHCVGGYCPDVMEGRSRIFSLRDAKGEPHVTVEVEPAPRIGFREGEGPKTPEERFDLQTEWLQGVESGKIGGDVTFANWWRQKNNIPEPELPFQISQIKGKQNRAPKEEYLPFVQDFVRGGQWAKVNDFGNTGLVRKSDLIDKFTPEQLDAVGVGEYLTKGEYDDLLLKALQPPAGMKKGGKVRFTDNPDAMRLELQMAAGGIAKGLKGLAKGMKKEPAVPVDIPRVRPTPQAIEQAAERVARQQLGEHVRSPVLDDTKNLAGRSMKESQRLQKLQYKLTPTKELPPVQTYEQKIGDVNIALPGDQTVADMILESIEDIPIGSVQEGGAFYGLGKLADPEEYRAFWASNESAAQNFQNKVNEIAKQFDTDQVTAHHLAMGTTSNNFAMHFADANLRAIDYSKLNRRDMETFDRAIADGYTKKNQKTGEYEHISFPNWPGIADPEGAKLAMRADPELRKWFNNRMKVPKLTQATNMPDGRSIQWAITEPLIRNSEINLTGLSVGRMKPGAELIPGSKHQTYSHDIAGTALGKAQELAPFEISFPDVTSFVREQYRPQDFTGTIQKVFPHQVVDEAYLEDLNKYYQRLRQIRGFNKGGAVHKAAGGEISADDLIIEERPL